MTTSYCTTDLSKWGAGLGRPLHSTEIDVNFWEINERVADLEAAPAPPPAIDHFETVGTTMYVHFADSTVMGPYALPVASYRRRGSWTPSTSYSVLDTFTENGATYEVLVSHISDSTFDPDATDGSGNDLYAALFESPGNSLPTGGAAGQKLSKSSSANYAVTWSWTFPAGTAGKFLRQASGTQDDVEWAIPEAGEIGFTPVTGSLITSDNVADALEELSGAAVRVTGSPASGDLLKYDGSGWSPATYVAASKADPTVTALDASTPLVDPSLGRVFTLTPTGSVSVSATTTPAGREVTIIVTTSGTSSYNITFDGSFKTQGTLATGTVSGKMFAINFVSDGTRFVETGRTTAM